MRLLPRSLFGRTALLIASTVLIFSLIAWQAIVWSTLVPAADWTSALLTQRANAALAARRAAQPLPQGARFELQAPARMEPQLGGLAIRAYMETIRASLQANLRASEAHVHRFAGPSEIWLRTPAAPGVWLVLSWHIAGPGAPWAGLVILGAAALSVLGAAAFSARRLTAPLAALAAAAARLAQGEWLELTSTAGPSEVRSLAIAFESMSHRLAELDEQRELMLSGISHDLRTPLARLRVALELVEPPDPGLSRQMIADIEEMDRMIGQFLHYTRTHYREPPTQASLDELTCRTLAVYAQNPDLTLALGASEPRCFAAEGVRHVLLNLVQNALEYGAPPVIVRTSLSARELTIEVLDQGAGLSPSEWSQALQPFRRLRDQPAGPHTGLGLAMVDRLVRNCGGHLTAERGSAGFAVVARMPAHAA